MSHFAAVLEKNTSALEERWVRRVSESQHPDSSSHSQLVAQLPRLTSALIGALRGEPVEPPALPRTGFDARAAVREYGLLADVALELAAEWEVALQLPELRVFTRFISRLTSDVVTAHALQQEQPRIAVAAVVPEVEPPRRAITTHSAPLFEQTVGGKWELDVATQLVIADPALLELHQLPPTSPVPLASLRIAIHPEDLAGLDAVVQAALDPNGSGQYQAHYRVNAGPDRHRWIETTGQTIFDAYGVPQLVLGTAVDVSRRKEAELAREGMLEALQALPLIQVIAIEGPERVVTLMNAEFRHNVAGGRDLVGLPIRSAFPSFVEERGTVARGVLQSGKPYIARNVAMRVDRGRGLEERHFDFVMQPLRGRFGSVDGLLSLSLDVTESVEARRALETFVEQEKERAQLERQIIGVVSHDLGNPVAMLKLGVAQLLSSPSLDASADKVVRAMAGTLDGMGRLVDDLLDFAQARGGSGLSIVRAPMNLHEVVRKVVDELRQRFPARELMLEEQGDGAGSWDRTRLAQAAVNLIGNALKHGASNLPVRVSTQGFAEHVELRVFNQGEPISADVLPRLFEPLQRGKAQAVELGRSVGLGLYIVKHIVDALGGTISVTSTAQAGTTFVVAFPRN